MDCGFPSGSSISLRRWIWGISRTSRWNVLQEKADEHRTKWTEMDEAVRSKLIDASVEESIPDYGNTRAFTAAPEMNT